MCTSDLGAMREVGGESKGHTGISTQDGRINADTNNCDSRCRETHFSSVSSNSKRLMFCPFGEGFPFPSVAASFADGLLRCLEGASVISEGACELLCLDGPGPALRSRRLTAALCSGRLERRGGSSAQGCNDSREIYCTSIET